jgi:hypothetical protein
MTVQNPMLVKATFLKLAGDDNDVWVLTITSSRFRGLLPNPLYFCTKGVLALRVGTNHQAPLEMIWAKKSWKNLPVSGSGKQQKLETYFSRCTRRTQVPISRFLWPSLASPPALYFITLSFLALSDSEGKSSSIFGVVMLHFQIRKLTCLNG